MVQPTPLRPGTQLAQGLGAHDPQFGGLVPAIHPSTTFLRDADYKLQFENSYSRPIGPTHLPAEAVLASLEGGAAAMLFGSGMAAATAVFQALKPGDHVIAPEVMYSYPRRASSRECPWFPICVTSFVAFAFWARCRASCTDQQSGFWTYTCLPTSIADDAMIACM